MVDRLHAAELKLSELERGYRELDKLILWKQEHVLKAQWFYDHESEIRQLVGMARWTLMARKIFAWLAGALVAIATFMVWLKEHVGRFLN